MRVVFVDKCDDGSSNRLIGVFRPETAEEQAVLGQIGQSTGRNILEFSKADDGDYELREWCLVCLTKGHRELVMAED